MGFSLDPSPTGKFCYGTLAGGTARYLLEGVTLADRGTTACLWLGCGLARVADRYCVSAIAVRDTNGLRDSALLFPRDQLQNPNSEALGFALSDPRHFEQFGHISGPLAAQRIDRGVMQNHIRWHSLCLG
jgi:hypothetical protein